MTNSPLAPIKAIVGIQCCDIFHNSQRIQEFMNPDLSFFFIENTEYSDQMASDFSNFEILLKCRTVQI